MATKGCPKKRGFKIKKKSADFKAAVRCCNTKGDCFSKKKIDCPGKGKGNRKTYEEAKTICSDKGLRLCNDYELEACCGTGCMFDVKTIWIAKKSK